jgi:hypothetical protein
MSTDSYDQKWADLVNELVAYQSGDTQKTNTTPTYLEMRKLMDEIGFEITDSELENALRVFEEIERESGRRFLN